MDGSEKINKILEDVGLTPSKFAKVIGVKSAQNIYDIQKNKVDVSKDVAIRIIRTFPQFSLEWLLTGEGEMLKDTSHTEQMDIKGVLSERAFTVVPLLPVSARGGSLDDFVSSVRPEECEKIVSPIGGVDFAITVVGDSMAPEYPNGATVLIKRINERAFIVWGQVYVLDTCNGSVIKKIMPGPDDSSVTCVSFNDEYPPFNVRFEDMFGMYRVMMLLALK